MNQQQYDLIRPYKYYWESLQKNGSLENIPASVLIIFASVQDEILNVKTKISCKNCVIEMIQFLGTKVKKYEQEIEA